MERALDAPVHVLAVDEGVRLHAPAPDRDAASTWKRTLAAMRSADRWGSTDTACGPEVWAEIFDEVST